MATSPPRADYETLATLLASLFEMSELRNLLRSKYPDVIAELSEHMTLVHFVHDAVRVLDRRGVLDEDFFSTLTRVRPRRRNDIIALASLWRSGREPLRARVDAVAPDGSIATKLLARRPSSSATPVVQKRECGLAIPTTGDTQGYWAAVQRMITDSLHGWSVRPLNASNSSNSIQRTVLQRLQSDRVVIFDLSTNNPNVMYELGVRHALGKPAVLIANDKTALPFDAAATRYFVYPANLGPELTAFKQALSDEVERIAKSGHTSDEQMNEVPTPAPDYGRWPPSDATISFSVSQYGTFFRVACASYRKLHEVQDREIEWQNGSTESPDPQVLRKSSYEQRQRFAAVAVVFSAITLESFINHYGHQLDADLHSALDRSNVAKWQLFPMLRCGKKLASDGLAMKGIGDIFRIYDWLVHDKPHSFTFGPDLDSKDIRVMPIDLATKLNPIRHVRVALTALQQIDPSVEIGWAFENGPDDWGILL